MKIEIEKENKKSGETVIDEDVTISLLSLLLF
jgi:hypothetical protein